MGHKRTSNDADLVQPDQYIVSKNKRAKTPLTTLAIEVAF